MMKRAVKNVTIMIGEIGIFTYTAVLAVVKATVQWMKTLIEYI